VTVREEGPLTVVGGFVQELEGLLRLTFTERKRVDLAVLFSGETLDDVSGVYTSAADVNDRNVGAGLLEHFFDGSGL